MMGHKICSDGEILIIIPKLSLLPLLIWSTVVQHIVSLTKSLVKDMLSLLVHIITSEPKCFDEKRRGAYFFSRQ